MAGALGILHVACSWPASGRDPLPVTASTALPLIESRGVAPSPRFLTADGPVTAARGVLAHRLIPAAHAAPAPATLTRGINITGWFRFPASRDPAALAAYLSDQALADLRAAGFDFVRLAIDPAVADTQRPVLIAAIRRIQRQGLTVVVSPHPHDWHLETDPADRDRLRAFWQTLAPALRTLDPARTVPEVLNEPVFPNDPGRLGGVAAPGADRHTAGAAQRDGGADRPGLGQHRRAAGADAGGRPERPLQLPFLRSGGTDVAGGLPAWPRPGGAGAPAVPGGRPAALRGDRRRVRRLRHAGSDAVLLRPRLGRGPRRRDRRPRRRLGTAASRAPARRGVRRERGAQSGRAGWLG